MPDDCIEHYMSVRPTADIELYQPPKHGNSFEEQVSFLKYVLCYADPLQYGLHGSWKLFKSISKPTSTTWSSDWHN